MSGRNRILYTIAKYDPSPVTANAESIADVHEHDDLICALSKDGASKYNNVLLSMVRYLIDNTDANGSIQSKAMKEIADAFIGTDFNDVEDTDRLHLVERVIVRDEISCDPSNVWTVDVRVFKAVLMRKLAHSGMKEDDLQVVIFKHRLDQYYSSVKIGGVDDSEKISFVNRYNHYLYEFYKRSVNPDADVLQDYSDKASAQVMLASFRNQDCYSKIVFSYELSLRGTLEQAEADIKDHCDNIMHYTKRMYELSYGEDYCKASSGQGKSHYKEKFKVYDKCLLVYDRYKEKVSANGSIDDEKFGRTIDRTEGTSHLPDRKRLDHRKDIRKHYKMALDLIKQSTEGYLS